MLLTAKGTRRERERRAERASFRSPDVRDGLHRELVGLLGVDATQLTLCFEDQAPPFDPLQYLAAAAPPLDAPAEERRVGGLGLPLVAQMARQFDYVRADGWNRVRLVLGRDG